MMLPVRRVAGEIAMDHYSLRFIEDGIGAAKLVEFEAHDASRALTLAHMEAAGRAAELWRGDRKLCTLKRTGRRGEIWQVGPGF
jgi:hypothetical protein